MIVYGEVVKVVLLGTREVKFVTQQSAFRLKICEKLETKN